MGTDAGSDVLDGLERGTGGGTIGVEAGGEALEGEPCLVTYRYLC
jgi:hypothetical protein